MATPISLALLLWLLAVLLPQRFGHTKVISARALLRYVEGERTFMRGDI